MKNSDRVIGHLTRRAAEERGAVLTDNTGGVQSAQVVSGHGWAEVVEGVPQGERPR